MLAIDEKERRFRDRAADGFRVRMRDEWWDTVERLVEINLTEVVEMHPTDYEYHSVSRQGLVDLLKHLRDRPDESHPTVELTPDQYFMVWGGLARCVTDEPNPPVPSPIQRSRIENVLLRRYDEIATGDEPQLDATYDPDRNYV